MRRRDLAATALALAAACGGNSGTGTGDPLDADPGPAIDAAPAAGDGFPRGAIGFFMTTLCPTGWTTYTDAVGRTLVPSAPGDVGVTAGTPLAANERRLHHHDLAIGVDLPSISYAGIAGEANHGVARGGHLDATSRTTDSGNDPPYAQLLVCRKISGAGPTPPPRGVITFIAGGTCPTGWTMAPTELQGRFLVARPTDGTAGATFGGAPLTSGELRAHSHTIVATLTTSSHGIALAGGGAAGGYAATGTHVTTTTALPAVVDMPYLQLLACVAP